MTNDKENKRHAIGVDIGATFTKMVLVDEAGKILVNAKVKTPSAECGVDGFLSKLMKSVRNFLHQSKTITSEVSGIGFAVPCYVAGEEWRLTNVSNMTYLEGVALHRILEVEFGTHIAMMNDTSAAGLGEYRFGKGRGYERMFFIGIGTGISSSFVTRAAGLVCFNWDTNGDTGHIIVDPQGTEECPCGARGCLESIAAAPAIKKRAMREIQAGRQTTLVDILARKGEIDAKDVSTATRRGDQIAQEIMEKAGTALGVALTSYIHIFCPDVIVIGGGVSRSGKLIMDPAVRTINKMVSPWYKQRLKAVEITSLGVKAGAIGSACLILYPPNHHFHR